MFERVLPNFFAQVDFMPLVSTRNSTSWCLGGLSLASTPAVADQRRKIEDFFISMFRFITLKAWLLSKSCEMFFNVCQLSSVTQRLLFTSRRGSGHHDPMYLSNIGSSRLFHRVSVATSDSGNVDIQQGLSFESRQLSTLSWLEMFGRASSSVKRRTWFESLWSFVSFILLENKKTGRAFTIATPPWGQKTSFKQLT